MHKVDRRTANPSWVSGLDQSLTKTGLANWNGIATIKPTVGLTGTRRLIYLRDEILRRVRNSTLVAMEGFAFAAKGKQHEIGGLGWIIRVALDEAGIRWVEVPPTSLKMFATGRGNANKSEVVVAAVQRLGLTPKDDNQADAAWLEEFGHHLLGKPRTDLPQLHLRALDKVRLPT